MSNEQLIVLKSTPPSEPNPDRRLPAAAGMRTRAATQRRDRWSQW